MLKKTALFTNCKITEYFVIYITKMRLCGNWVFLLDMTPTFISSININQILSIQRSLFKINTTSSHLMFSSLTLMPQRYCRQSVFRNQHSQSPNSQFEDVVTRFISPAGERYIANSFSSISQDQIFLPNEHLFLPNSILDL